MHRARTVTVNIFLVWFCILGNFNGALGLRRGIQYDGRHLHKQYRVSQKGNRKFVSISTPLTDFVKFSPADSAENL